MHFLMHSLTKSKIIIIIIISPFLILLKSRGFLNDCDYHNSSQHRPTVTQLFPSISRIRSTNLSLSTKRKSNQKSETAPKLHFSKQSLTLDPTQFSLSLSANVKLIAFSFNNSKKKEKKKKANPTLHPNKIQFFYFYFLIQVRQNAMLLLSVSRGYKQPQPIANFSDLNNQNSLFSFQFFHSSDQSLTERYNDRQGGILANPNKKKERKKKKKIQSASLQLKLKLAESTQWFRDSSVRI